MNYQALKNVPEQHSHSGLHATVAIVESIGEHRQSPQSVADALCKHSPGTVSIALQAAIRSEIENIAPQL